MSQNKKNEALLEAFEKVKTQELPSNVNIESDDVNDIVKFIIRTNIKPGNSPFKTNFLYRLFKSMYKNEIRNQEFFKTLSSFVTIDNGTAFIDLNEFQGITPEKFFIKKEKNHFVLTKNNRLVVKHLDEFVQLFKIKAGDYPVPAMLMKRIFARWRKLKTKTTPGKNAYILLNKMLPKKITRFGMYYIIELNEESRKVIKEDEVKEYIEKQKRSVQEAQKRRRKAYKKQEKQRKISSIRSAIELKESSGIK